MDLSHRDLKAIEILARYQNKDLEVNLIAYRELLGVLISLHEVLAQSQVKFEIWKGYSDTLMTKFFLHSNTLAQILTGGVLQLEFKDGIRRNIKILDVSSSKVVLRAQLEAYLMYHHIYVNPKTEDEKELRFNAWMCASLLDRQSLPAATDFTIAQLKKDKEDIAKLRLRMEQLPAFKNLSDNQQKILLEKGSAKLFKHWRTILHETGFGEGSIYNRFYGLLSNYAHSEGLSILQLQESKFTYNKNDETANLNVFMSTILLARMVLSIKGLYKMIEIQYNGLPQSFQDTIEIYARLGDVRSD